MTIANGKVREIVKLINEAFDESGNARALILAEAVRIIASEMVQAMKIFEED